MLTAPYTPAKRHYDFSSKQHIFHSIRPVAIEQLWLQSSLLHDMGCYPAASLSVTGVGLHSDMPISVLGFQSGWMAWADIWFGCRITMYVCKVLCEKFLMRHSYSLSSHKCTSVGWTKEICFSLLWNSASVNCRIMKWWWEIVPQFWSAKDMGTIQENVLVRVNLTRRRHIRHIVPEPHTSHFHDWISNAEVRRPTGYAVAPVSSTIRWRRLRLFGHRPIARADQSSDHRVLFAVISDPPAGRKCPRGRPRSTWSPGPESLNVTSSDEHGRMHKDSKYWKNFAERQPRSSRDEMMINFNAKLHFATFCNWVTGELLVAF